LTLLGYRSRDERMLQHATPSFIERDAMWSKQAAHSLTGRENEQSDQGR